MKNQIDINEKKIFEEALAEFLKYKPDTHFVEKCPTDIIEDIHKIIEFAIHRIDRRYQQMLEHAKRLASKEVNQEKEEENQKDFFKRLEEIPQEKKKKVLSKIMV
ncbi:hypothetical protein LCGC14_2386070 [marine sediment metagenome]|uniref:Uncharacterized protein n=1 Tax=marine sediment metagenome TaxID=412755 RepID=A0A0F9BZN7_9ZZZZ